MEALLEKFEESYSSELELNRGIDHAMSTLIERVFIAYKEDFIEYAAKQNEVEIDEEEDYETIENYSQEWFVNNVTINLP